MSDKLPSWVNPVLQGLAYWFGHRRQYYRHYDVFEGAIVYELCNLLTANLKKGEKIYCEIPYETLGGKQQTGIKGRKESADVVIAVAECDGRKELAEKAQAVLEIKRYSHGSTKKLIMKDLARLHCCIAGRVKEAEKMRGFLIVTAEATVPKEFLGDTYEALGGAHAIPGTNGHYKVRRVCKAVSSFRPRAEEKAHYACLLEVLVS